jgi:Cu/Ag efflux protein CusF
MEIEMMPRTENSIAQAPPAPSSALATIVPRAQGLLKRMFADPNVLAKEERAELVNELRKCVVDHPAVSELRVLYGMALCVNLEVQAAMEELREGVRLAPDSFIAQLKMGELWMRLRVCDKAKEHTHQAAVLAQNMAQSELARRQAATIRTMMREGIERGGYSYKSPWQLVASVRKLWKRDRPDVETLMTVETQ